MPGAGEEKEGLSEPIVPITALSFKTATKIISVEIADILYAEADGKYSLLHTKSNVEPLEVFHLLGEIAERLQKEGFVRCSRFHLVNLAYCKSWRHTAKTALVFLEWDTITQEITTQEITVSGTYKAEFIRCWEEKYGKLIAPRAE
ncbi:MAG: LytTR family transcriptional regulator [Candidatus Kapabacteria bacterium]|jgi:DNA-binding LytR/AlgR family response regulator|nr:LytTR family transcriptional regulator [Candidatus Kapabacteria bacterium]